MEIPLSSFAQYSPKRGRISLTLTALELPSLKKLYHVSYSLVKLFRKVFSVRNHWTKKMVMFGWIRTNGN